MICHCTNTEGILTRQGSHSPETKRKERYQNCCP